MEISLERTGKTQCSPRAHRPAGESKIQRARRRDGPGKWWGLTRGLPRSIFGACTGWRRGPRASRWPAADCSCASAAARRRPATARPGGAAVTWLGRGGPGEVQEGRCGLAAC
jgi:hypothetical protein